MTRQNTIDTALVVADGTEGAKTANFAYTSIVHLGTGNVRGRCQIDVNAADATTGDEGYTLWLQGSTSATFASTIVNLGALNIGGATRAEAGGTPDVASTTGTYNIGFENQVAGVKYPYVRLYLEVSGTSPSLTLGPSYLAVQK